MALLPAGQADLFLPLLEGPGDPRQWERFLAALLARTGARQAALAIVPAQPAAGPAILRLSAERAPGAPPLDIAALAGLGLARPRKLRPGRVYALEELFDYDDPDAPERQRAALAARGIRFARRLRVTGERAVEAWVLLVREREDFGAAAAALLSSAAPWLRAALRAFADASEERLARGMAQAALARLGIGQVALDAGGRVIAADGVAERALAFVAAPGGRAGRRLALPPPAAERLERACAAFATDAAAEPVLIAVEGVPALLLHPAGGPALPAEPLRPAAIATLRLPEREDERRAAAVLQALHRLAPREAALAAKLSRGATIAEAGRSLSLTEETARNYSKRIYARTDTRGQADLVRAVLCGLAPLA